MPSFGPWCRLTTTLSECGRICPDWSRCAIFLPITHSCGLVDGEVDFAAHLQAVLLREAGLIHARLWPWVQHAVHLHAMQYRSTHLKTLASVLQARADAQAAERNQRAAQPQRVAAAQLHAALWQDVSFGRMQKPLTKLEREQAAWKAAAAGAGRQ